MSAAGREVYRSAIAAFTERARAARRSELDAARRRCRSANRTVREIAIDKVGGALRCLARRDKASPLPLGPLEEDVVQGAG